MKKVLFLDRDGVLNRDTGYLHSVDELEWIPGAKAGLAYAHSKGYDLIVVTNQSGIGRGYYAVEDMNILHEHMNRELTANGAPILHFYYCPHHKEGTILEYAIECDCRKPKPGMILQAFHDYDIDQKASFLIGDSPRDVEAAEAAGIQGYLFDGVNLLHTIQAILRERIQ